MVDADEFANNGFATGILRAAQMAGAAIMDVYAKEIEVAYKEDRSPVTLADGAAEEILLTALDRLCPGIPVVAEERFAAGNSPDIGPEFFLVDPLDGTKEFLKRNGEFTVNVALIRRGTPVFGLVYAPAFSDCYLTLGPGRAVRCALPPARASGATCGVDFRPLTGEAAPGRPFTVLVSRSNRNPQTQAFVDGFEGAALLTVGSSLKFCVLARGEADVYPRFGPTSEWDIAAGHAILAAAGGEVEQACGSPLEYGHQDRAFINPPFIARRRLPAA